MNASRNLRRSPVQRLAWRAVASASALVFVATSALAEGVAEPAAPPASTPAVAPAASSPASAAATGIAALSFEPSQLDFRAQALNSTSTVQTVTLTAGRGAVLDVGGRIVVNDIHASGDFSVSPNRCEMEAAGSCALTVTFAPKQLGVSRSAIVGSEVRGSAAPSRVIAPLSGEGVARCDASKMPGCVGSWHLWPTGVMVGLYLLALVLVRWNLIARPSRGLLRAEIEAVRAELCALGFAEDGEGAPAKSIRGLLSKAELLVPADAFWFAPADVLFWSRGQESAGWELVHEAQERLVDVMQDERVQSELERSLNDLREMGTPGALDLAGRITKDLGLSVADANDAARSALAELLDFLQRPAPALRVELAGLLGIPPADPLPAFKDLAQRLATALAAPPSLQAQVGAALAATSSVPPPEFIALFRHASEALLPEAKALAQSLADGATAAPALTADVWKQRLQAVGSYCSSADACAARAQAALAATQKKPMARWKALLFEARGIVFERRDTYYDTLISWHNKTIWLTGCGLLLILALAASVRHEVFFLVGATGGLLSRLSRSLHRQDVPTDYGASWTTLFLSPVVGALTGWSGVLLVTLAVKLGVLGQMFADANWDCGSPEMLLGLALVFGFSERLFDTILSQLEEKIRTQPSPMVSVSGALKITSGAPDSPAKADADYAFKLQASGGSSPYVWSKTGGALPPGLQLDPAGQITGKPSADAKGRAWKFTLQVKDAAGGVVSSGEYGISVE